ncbi:type II secretion system protein [Candidatus Parcubacteria bacterium]|nr:MAG: type II secretion system protein [Candidatus Parcubacteria bacterium]
MLHINCQKARGVSLVEAIVAIAVFCLLITAIVGLISNVYLSQTQSSKEQQAITFAQEGLEAARSIRRRAWNLLGQGTYGLTNAAGYWDWNGSQDLQDGFIREITVEDVYRNPAGDIVSSPGADDIPDLQTKKIMSKVSWPVFPGFNTDVYLSEYFTNWQSKDWAQTDWSGGPGQQSFSDASKYFTDDGNIDYTTSGEIKLKSLSGGGCGNKIWDFTDLNYTLSDPAKIEISTSAPGYAQLVSVGGGDYNGQTVNPGFDTGIDPWVFKYAGGVTPSYFWQNTGGNPGGFGQISFPSAKNKTAIGYFEQPFLVDAQTITQALLSFDGTITEYSRQADIFKIYAFVDNFSGTPTLGQEVWSSAHQTGTISWTTISNIDVSSKINGPGIYYLKIGVYVDYPGLNANYIVGLDNASLFWSGVAAGSYATDRPTVVPAADFSVPEIEIWSYFNETAEKNGGEIYYQISDGSQWYWWNGSWITANTGDYNTADIVNANISSFATSTAKINFRAFLQSDGSQFVRLDKVEISCAKVAVWDFTDLNYTLSDPAKIEISTSAPGYAQLVGSGGMTGAAVWDFTDLNYTLSDPTKIEISTSAPGYAQLVGSTGSCIGTSTSCDLLAEADCNSQSGCSWQLGQGFCQDNGTCNGLDSGTCNSCAGAGCSKAGKNCTGTLNCSIYSQTECGICSQCLWSGGVGTCSGYPTSCDYFTDNLSCVSQLGCSWNNGSYTTDYVWVLPNSSYTDVNMEYWTSFTETAEKNGGEIYYQLSNDNGASWYYYNVGWQLTVDQYSPAADISANIASFPASTKQIKFRAFLHSPTGTEFVRLDKVEVGWGAGGAGLGSCTGTPNPCTSFSQDEQACLAQTGCIWMQGQGSCENVGSCSGLDSGICNSCAGAGCSKAGKNCAGTLNCSVYNQSECVLCSQCNWTGTVSSCSGIPNPCEQFNTESSCLSQIGCAWTSGGAVTFPTDNPWVRPDNSFAASNIHGWNYFYETAEKNGGEIYYQLSDDDGITWQWFDGNNWSVINTPSDMNTAVAINQKIYLFPAASQKILFKAFLHSPTGSEFVKLDEVKVGYSDAGEGGGGFVLTGILESSAFNTNSQSSFNIVSWSEILPSVNENIKIQLSTAPDSGGMPGVWTEWTGISGAGTYYDDSAETIIPFENNHNYHQWIKYRAELTGDGTDSPVLHEIKLNYTP